MSQNRSGEQRKMLRLFLYMLKRRNLQKIRTEIKQKESLLRTKVFEWGIG